MITKKLRLSILFLAFTIFLLAFILDYNKFVKTPTTFGDVLGISDSQTTGTIPSNYKNIGIPGDMVTLSNGDMWYIDTLNTRLVKISSNGTILRTVGRFGKDDGELDGYPNSITVDDEGNLYITHSWWQFGETDNINKISKFDFNGGFIKEWGTMGSGDGEFVTPIVIHYDAHSDCLLVVDSANGRIQKFTKDGEFVSKFSMPVADGETSGPFGITTDTSGKIYVTTTLSTGIHDARPQIQVFNPDYSLDFTFTDPGIAAIKDIEVLTNGNILVTSQNSNRTDIFSSTGTLIREISGFQHPSYLTKDSNNNFFISDYTLNSITKYTAAGDLVSAFDYSNSGLTNGKLTGPDDISYDSAGNLYVLHFGGGSGNPQVEKFTNGGTFISNILGPNSVLVPAYMMTIHNDFLYVTDQCGLVKFELDGTLIGRIGNGCGTGDGQFDETRGVAFDSSENSYTTDLFNRRVQKFDSTGNFVRAWGGEGAGNGQFVYPGDIAIDSNNIIYVGDNGNRRIQKFDTDGNYLGEISDIDSGYLTIFNDTLYVGGINEVKVMDLNGTVLDTFGAAGSGLNQFQNISGIAINPITETVTVCDHSNHRIELFGAGVRIVNLNPSADVLRVSDSLSLANGYVNPAAPGVNSINSQLKFGPYLVSDFSVNLTDNRDWSEVNAITLPNESKALIKNLNPTTAPGVSTTHSLYLVKKAGEVSVHICPDATTIAELTMECANGYTLVSGVASNLSTVTTGNVTYWKITGLTGTGGLSVPTTTPSPTPTPTVTRRVTMNSNSNNSTPTPTSTTTGTVTVTPSVTTTGGLSDITPPPRYTQEAVNSCPSFKTLTVSSTLVKPGSSVQFNWTTANTDTVTTSLSTNSLDNNGSLNYTPDKTQEITFTAKNSECTKEKKITVSVVNTFPWETTISLGTGTLIVEAAIALQQPMMVGNIWLAFASIFDRKKKRSWGIVYDSVTKKPLARAVIRLVDNTTKKTVQTVVSEANGLFRLVPKIGTFVIQVSRAQYTFPSIAVSSKEDGGFPDIYHGDVIKIESETQKLLMSIPLDPIALTAKELASTKTKVIVEQVINYSSYILLLGGFIYSIYAAYRFPIGLNLFILAMYTVIVQIKVVLFLYSPRSQGKVTDSKGTPIGGLELGLFDSEFDNLLYRTFTTKDGSYCFTVPTKNYVIKVLDTKYTLNESGTKTGKTAVKGTGSDSSIMLVTEDLVVKGK